MEQELHRVRREIKSLGQLRSAAMKIERAQRTRDASRRKHALQVAIIALGHDLDFQDDIIAYLRRKYDRAFQETDEELTKTVTDEYMATADENLSSWLDWNPVSVTRTAMTEARRLVDDMRVLQWVREEHSVHGLAPPPRTLLQKRRAAGLAPVQFGTEESQPETEAGPRKWIQRFRRRWGLHLGALPVEETVPVDDARSKVHRRVIKFDSFREFLDPEEGPFCGPFFGTALE